MEWPSRSPDLKIIEHVCGLPVRKVYANRSRFRDFDRLTDAFGKGRDEIDGKYPKNLYQYLPTRVIEVIKRRWACTDY